MTKSKSVHSPIRPNEELLRSRLSLNISRFRQADSQFTTSPTESLTCNLTLTSYPNRVVCVGRAYDGPNYVGKAYTDNGLELVQVYVKTSIALAERYPMSCNRLHGRSVICARTRGTEIVTNTLPRVLPFLPGLLSGHEVVFGPCWCQMLPHSSLI